MAMATNQATPQTFHPISIDAELYGYLVTGNVSGFHRFISSKQVDVHELRCPRDNSTVLHTAASVGQAELVSDLLSHWPDLMVRANSKGDLAIHSTLKSGRLDIVEALMTTKWGQDGNPEVDKVFGWKNGEGNTTLHIALENDQVEMAKHLVDLYPQACYLMNKKDNICPLYMAITMELSDLVHHMLAALQSFREEANHALREGKPVVHASISAHGLGVLEQIAENYPELIDTVDEEGRTPLSYVAYMGDLVKFQLLLNLFPNTAFLRDQDEDGSFPIHQAVRGGHINVMNELTISQSLSNARGQNILHVASQTGDSNLIAYLLRMPKSIDTSLINQRDEDGNTPLHLATLEKHIEVVDILTRDDRVKVELTNKDGLKARDLVEINKKLTSTLDDPKINDVNKKLINMLDNARIGRKPFAIDSELYDQLLVSGDINQVNLFVSTKGVRLEDLECPKNNTLLHIAASMDRYQLISDLQQYPSCGRLMLRANNNGDLPIHFAAKAGNLRVLSALLESGGDHIPDDICLRSNSEGNTVLHIAVITRRREMASYLFGRCPTAAYYSNNDKISPLCLALQTDSQFHLFDDLINGMIRKLDDPQNVSLLKNAKSVVHAAIFSRRKGNLENIIDKAPDLIDSFDPQGRRPLSYAAYLGNHQAVQLLLTKFPHLAFKRDYDKDKSFPVHNASKGGHLKVVKMFQPTDTMRFLNGKCQNILHVAAKEDNSTIISFLLKLQEYKELINAGDEDGNTPLHLATQGLCARVIYILAKEQINGALLNNDNLTAADLHRLHLPLQDDRFYFTWKLIEKMLKRTVEEYEWSSWKGRWAKEMMKKDKADDVDPEGQKRKSERENAYLVAATLIIAVTFAAVVGNIPGGYNASGHAKLADDLSFQLFTLFNTIAFGTSVLCVAAIIPMHSKLHDTLGLFLGLAIAFMPLTFCATFAITCIGEGMTWWFSEMVLGISYAFCILSLAICWASFMLTVGRIRIWRCIFFLGCRCLLPVCPQQYPKANYQT